MNFIYNHPYISLFLGLAIINMIVKKLTKKRHGPIGYLFLLLINTILPSCSSLGEKVDKNNSNYYYSLDEKQIYFCAMGNWFELGKTVMDVDVESFRVLSDYYWARDKNYLYFESHKLDYLDIDLDTIHFIDFMSIHDTKNVFIINFAEKYGEKPVAKVEGADPNSYKNLEAAGFAKDKNFLFYENKKTNIDPASFKKLNYSFAQDDQNLYLLGKTKENETHIVFDTLNIDFNSLEVLDDYTIRNESALYTFHYYGDNETAPKLFTFPINESDIFYYEKQAFFRINDKIYMGIEHLEDVDAETFKSLSFGYFRDKNNLYFTDKLIEGVDFETLKFNEDKHTYEDKNYRYIREDKEEKLSEQD
ncbi:MAG: DKNYY domain-containing protein [Marinifilaceae bacterium]|jgi:hypothetical protein|nr:DKNYY domain-containing protein [Marinifilaceae bacterium]